MRRRQGIPASAFMASFTSAGQPRLTERPQMSSPLDSHPDTVVERWNGHKFIEVPLTWNGANYEENN